MALFLVVVTVILATGYVDTLTSENKTVKDNETAALAFYAADAGIQYALEAIRLNQPANCTDVPHGVEARLFTSSGNDITFTLSCVNPILSPVCPAGSTCFAYRSTGTVVSGGHIIARKIVESVITIESAANAITWDEYFI